MHSVLKAYAASWDLLHVVCSRARDGFSPDTVPVCAPAHTRSFWAPPGGLSIGNDQIEVPSGPVLKHGPRSLSCARANGVAIGFAPGGLACKTKGVKNITLPLYAGLRAALSGRPSIPGCYARHAVVVRLRAATVL